MKSTVKYLLSRFCVTTLFAIPGSAYCQDPVPATNVATTETRSIEGWTAYVNNQLLHERQEPTEKAIQLLTIQLKEITRVVPAPALERLREVRLWISPEYPNTPPRAEYHPSPGWLTSNGRDPAMGKGVEFTNVRIFEAETIRMPSLALHELAHGYHDRVLGFENPEIKAAYEHAKASKSYDAVERWHGGGRPNTTERAYAMANAQEYFAETTEAYFGRNDFFPFTRADLQAHDPGMAKLLERLWNPGAAISIQSPPAEIHAPAFYKKYISANGYPIVASGKVNDYALREAAYLVNLMLAKRPDLREAMVKSGSRLCIMAHDEFTTDLPEWSHMKPRDFWDARARGMGGSQTDPFCSCGEENLLAFRGDPYAAENILIHEFAHNIHLRGMVNLDTTFDTRVETAYKAAMATGLWKGKYASVNHHEYFAEGVQSWFDNNRVNDHDHNHVNTRVALLDYDPALAALCREVFGDTELKYTYPATRLRDHLAGYNPSTAPAFIWPERVKTASAEIRRKAQIRNRAAEGATSNKE